MVKGQCCCRHTEQSRRKWWIAFWEHFPRSSAGYIEQYGGVWGGEEQRRWTHSQVNTTVKHSFSLHPPSHRYSGDGQLNFPLWQISHTTTSQLLCFMMEWCNSVRQEWVLWVWWRKPSGFTTTFIITGVLWSGRVHAGTWLVSAFWLISSSFSPLINNPAGWWRCSTSHLKLSVCVCVCVCGRSAHTQQSTCCFAWRAANSHNVTMLDILLHLCGR